MKKEKKKCEGCKHLAKYHYKSDYKKTLGWVVCSKDNCYRWQQCDQKGWDDADLLGKH